MSFQMWLCLLIITNLYICVDCQLQTFKDNKNVTSSSNSQLEHEEVDIDSIRLSNENERQSNDQHLSNKLVDLFRFTKLHSVPSHEFISNDGWFHNLDTIEEGSKGSPLLRMFTPKLFSSNHNFPNVFSLSESLLKEPKNNKQVYSINGKNSLFAYFGMFVMNELLDSSHLRCPPSYHKIRFPEKYLNEYGIQVDYHPTTEHSFMWLNKAERCKLNKNSINSLPKKMNMRSVWIDGETIYGDTKFCSDQIRTFKNGKLINYETVDHSLISNLDCFDRFGSILINKNQFTWTIHLLWYRWHNLVADIIYLNHPHLPDEIIYQESKKVTVATMQHIVFNEWYPVLVGEQLPTYTGYNPKLNPQVSHLFDATIPLYLYSLITPFVFKLATDCSSNRHSLIRTCNSYDKSFDHLRRAGFEKLIAGMMLQSAKKDNQYFSEDIRGYSKGPMDFSRQDLVAILIQQARDFSIPDYLTIKDKLDTDNEYNSYRSIENYLSSLWPFASTHDKHLLQKIKTLYGNESNYGRIDAFIGGILEGNEYGPGALFTYLIKDQFSRIRDGDRMYFENVENGLFNQEQIKMIKEIKFSEIIKMVSELNSGLIQPDAFILPSERRNQISDRCRRSIQSLLEVYRCSNYGPDNQLSTNCLTLAIKKDGQHLEKCTEGELYDYFSGSQVSFAVTFALLGCFIILLIVVLKYLVYSKHKRSERIRLKMSKLHRMTISENTTLAQEWVGNNEGYRSVQILLNSKMKSINIKLGCDNRRLVRSIYLKDVVGKVWIGCSNNKPQNHILVRVPKEYDLVLKFDTYYEREKFLTKLEVFLVELHISQEKATQDLKLIFRFAYTKANRQRHLEQFFRVIFSYAFNKKSKENIDIKSAKEIIETELTQFEFAEALSMRADSTFVQQMFSLIDKDNNGYISFREFLDVIIIFAKGTAEQKIKIMFDMYDVKQAGRLSFSDFKGMIKSLLEIANQSISPIEMDQTIQSMLGEIGFSSKKELTFDDFNKLFNNYKEELGYSELNFDLSNISNLSQTVNKRQSAVFRANDTIVRAYSYFGGKSSPNLAHIAKQAPTFLKIETREHSKEPDQFISWVRFIDARKKEIFFIVMYTLLCIFIFLDKAYYYYYLTESSGLRKIVGIGVAITRGSASVMMLSFSAILLTMCRNLITLMRETFLHKYIPFDGAVTFHKYIALWGFVMSLVHTVGHGFNFYHISTQRPSDLNCLFRETYFVHNKLAKFHIWCFGTVTGLSGVLLLCLLLVINIFAIQYSRRHVFNSFWRTHNLYPLFYILIVLHGLGKLIQSPIFYTYFLLPISLFTIDRLISASRKRVEISVIKATLHPSEVTHLEFKKPPNFDYKSGQWVRIACLELNSNEYHPFTIASAPHEDTLSLFIRAVGPFTKNIRQVYDHNTLNGRPYPKLYLDGPYGEGHQDWLKFDVSVLVGGGIGITPFASIIKDISFRSSLNSRINCKKVYFLWVTRTQKQFEWMSDVIREAEAKDKNNLLVSHIFITQFYDKFDLRTTMLYICERHFQRISQKSLFTGLRAKTHFGRPNFQIFFDSLQQEHPNVERVGVFSCGPNPMTNSVQQACETLNRKEGAIFIHHFENF